MFGKIKIFINKRNIIYFIFLLFGTIVISFFIFFFRALKNKDIFNLRFNFQLKKNELKEYNNLEKNISFFYPIRFKLDEDLEKKYGNNYLIGVKLEHNHRSGCDLRQEKKINLENKENVEQIIASIKKGAQDFQVYENEEVLIDNKRGFKTSFSFKDPLDEIIMVEQILINHHDSTFILSCGSGIDYFPYLEKDFQIIYNSLTFNPTIRKKTFKEEIKNIF